MEIHLRSTVILMIALFLSSISAGCDLPGKHSSPQNEPAEQGPQASPQQHREDYSLTPSFSPANRNTSHPLDSSKEYLETQKLEAEVRKLEAETDKLVFETTLWGRILLYGTPLAAIVGLVWAVLRYFKDLRIARDQEVRSRFLSLIQQVGSESGQARVTAAVSLGIMAEEEDSAVRDVRREVVHTLLAQLASVSSGPEKATFASVLNSVLPKSKSLTQPPLDGADLSTLIFDDLSVSGATAVGSKIAHTSFCKAKLSNVRFRKLQESEGGAAFDQAVLKAVEFRDSTLREVSFDEAEIDGLVLHNCELERVRFDKLVGQPRIRLDQCAMSIVSFEGTDVSHIEIVNATDIDMKTRISLAGAKGVAKANLDERLKRELQELQKPVGTTPEPP